MTLSGTVMNGVVVLDGGPIPVEGTKVDVVVRAPTTDAGEGTATAGKPKGTLAFLLEFAGKVPDLPADFAEQHDHYIHGTPKR